MRCARYKVSKEYEATQLTESSSPGYSVLAGDRRTRSDQTPGQKNMGGLDIRRSRDPTT